MPVLVERIPSPGVEHIVKFGCGPPVGTSVLARRIMLRAKTATASLDPRSNGSLLRAPILSSVVGSPLFTIACAMLKNYCRPCGMVHVTRLNDAPAFQVPMTDGSFRPLDYGSLQATIKHFARCARPLSHVIRSVFNCSKFSMNKRVNKHTNS